MIGKSICKYLKSVRRAVAEANGIDLEIPECTFDGECSGTCPRCEAEVRMLEQALSARQRMAQKVAVLGVAAGLSFMGMPTASAQNITPTPPSTSELYEMDSVMNSTPAFIPSGTITRLPGDIQISKPSYDITLLGTSKAQLLKSTCDVEDIIKEASFPEGKGALDEYIERNLHYTEAAAKKGISGKVVVEFLVKADGQIAKVKTVKSVHPLLDAEAERLVASMPPWNPTIVNGRKVAYYYEITIQFLPQ